MPLLAGRGKGAGNARKTKPLRDPVQAERHATEDTSLPPPRTELP
jgi:hypothetical protein